MHGPHQPQPRREAVVRLLRLHLNVPHEVCDRSPRLHCLWTSMRPSKYLQCSYSMQRLQQDPLHCTQSCAALSEAEDVCGKVICSGA